MELRTLTTICVAVLTACDGGAHAPDAGVPDASQRSAANATLAALVSSAGALEPPFEPEITEYDLDLPLEQTDVTFTPVAATPSAVAVMIGSEHVESGQASSSIALPLELRTVVVAVSTPNGALTEYKIRIRRGVDALASLEVSRSTLNPTFAPATRQYATELPISTPSFEVRAIPLYPDRATISIGGKPATSGSIPLEIGTNSIPVVVKHERYSARQYSISARRGSDALRSLSLQHRGYPITSHFSPLFHPETTTYSLTVGFLLSSVSIVPDTFSDTTSITINGVAVTPGVPSPNINLNTAGLTPIQILATSTDGTAREHQISITRRRTLNLEGYFKPPAVRHGGMFGGEYLVPWLHPIALWNDTLVVGEPDEHSIAPYSGAVHIFAWDGTKWSPQAHLKAPTVGEGDGFGSSVAIWGDTLAVGTIGEDSSTTGINGDPFDNSARSSGAVYIFRRIGSEWRREAYIKASNTQSWTDFGMHLDLYEDTLVVGAPSEHGAGEGTLYSGAAYVFVRDGRSWTQQAYLKASNAEEGDGFGTVSIWEDTIAIGAAGEDSRTRGIGGDPSDNTAPDSGAVYIFVRHGTSWSQQEYIKASNTDEGDFFGLAVDLWHDVLIVGAPNEDSDSNGVIYQQDDNTAPDSGASYVFRRRGTAWEQDGYLKANASASGDHFGQAVAVWGDVVVVGSPQADNPGGVNMSPPRTDMGRVHIFSPRLPGWSFSTEVAGRDSGDNFGNAIACWGDLLAVAAPNEDSAAGDVNGDMDDNTDSDSGAVFLFR